MIIPINNKSKNFYAHLGKVFGSREVQRQTGDRFYDDDEKMWYLYYNRGTPDTFVSVRGNVIKNIWGKDPSHLVEVLRGIKGEIGESLVPKCFLEEYKEAEYTIIDNGTKNFVKIVGDYVEKTD